MDDNICKNWYSNIKVLQLVNVEVLNCVSPDLFLRGLHNIELKSLKKFTETKQVEHFNKYCDLQTKPFESTVQLTNGMKLIKNSEYLSNSVNNIYFQTKINANLENIPQRGDYFDQICDILCQWYENGNKNVLLRFEIESTSIKYTDFEYSQQFATCLYDKIRIVGDKDKLDAANTDTGIAPLAKGKFVSPYYGGNAKHCSNTIIINDRIAMGIHMNDQSGSMVTMISMQLIVQVVAKGQVFDEKQGLILIPCKCYYYEGDDDWSQDWCADDYWNACYKGQSKHMQASYHEVWNDATCSWESTDSM